VNATPASPGRLEGEKRMKYLWKLWYRILEDIFDVGFDYTDMANKIRRTGCSNQKEWDNFEHGDWKWEWEENPKVRH
jgi:hypothetical protein